MKLFFGPTTAKTELFNLIREDHKYDHLKIGNQTSRKMSYEEQHHFIKEYFRNFSTTKVISVNKNLVLKKTLISESLFAEKKN